jgi:hypothetical protein
MAANKSKPTQKAKKASSKAGPTLGFIIDGAQTLMDTFAKEQQVDSTLTTSERRRLIGAGVKNYGFIDKAYDIARDNPGFLPPFLSADDIWQDMHAFEEVRQLVMVLEKFLQLANENMLIRGNQCFRDALRVYGTLQEMTRNQVPGAKPLFESLMTFFHKRKKSGEKELTVKQIDRKLKALVSGTEEGEMTVKNEKARIIGGKRVVIDKTRSSKDKGEFKETEEGEEV